MSKIAQFILAVSIPDKMSAARAAALLDTLLEIGLGDASDTAESGEGDTDGAEEALSMNLGKIVALPESRHMALNHAALPKPCVDEEDNDEDDDDE